MHTIILGLKGFVSSSTALLRRHPLLSLVCALALMRLAMLGTYPLMDTTEARYGDIGRMMVVENDWITPWFRPGVPFWGKPPLSFWCTALSFKLFGVNEFSARLPHWVLGVCSGWFVWDLAIRRSIREAVIAISLLTGCLLYFFATGAVMTDMALTFGMVLSMWSFWIAVQPNQDRPSKAKAAWLFFVSLGWGLLAKGPLALVLTALAIGIWLLFSRQFVQAVTRLPWVRGFVLTALIAGPWYWAAERKTPGFLDYFLIGEHVKRFLVPGWKGDLYGNAHIHAHGTIWLYLLYMLIPWTLLIPGFLLFSTGRFRMPHQVGSALAWSDPVERAWISYLLCWGLAPAVLFTFASNIIMPYVLPGIPALALLGGTLLSRFDDHLVDRILATGLWIVLIGSLAFVLIFPLTGYGDRKSERALLRSFQAHRSPNSQLVYLDTYPFSAGFYGNGAVSDVPSVTSLEQRLNRPDNLFVALPKDTSPELDQLVQRRLLLVHRFRRHSLYQELPAQPGG
jgi:hypothetical protein